MAEGKKVYSWEEVARNNGKSGSRVWIVIKDIVYDVTDYLDDHPGGGDLILEFAGQDCTKAFDDAGHSGDAKKELKRFKIGELREEDRKQKQKKKQATVTDAPPEKANMRSCCSYLTCGLCG